ncbi:MAG TPA: hypothetical protein VM577_08550 [Anaerovoracaceae bacterium]|nr:hypothetical protein [Anaerovoracaceae bacterium]
MPKDLLEDFTELLKLLGTILPFGFSANPDLGMKTILDFIANLLTQIAPFLSFWNFIMALLKMIICIIEVLCALPNPFAVAAALATLFSECLPPFLNLFPFLALIAMIIALILLIIALILYIVETIIAIIEEIILNLIVLADGLTLSDVDSVLAAAAKIANLLCFIQNILAILIAIAAILAIIQALALIGGAPPCGDDAPSDCCSTSTCPPFIKNTPDGIPVSSGQLYYTSKVGVDLASILGISDDQAGLISIPPVREERWQLISNDPAPQYTIGLIITPVFIINSFPPTFSGIFWPDPLEFKSDLSPRTAPYTVDITVKMNPKQFQPTDTKGKRTFLIKDCIVVRKPYVGKLLFNNLLDFSNFQGTLNVEGGLVFEEDGTTKYMIDGYQGTLNTFIHKDDSLSDVIPSSDDSVAFDDLQFTWKPNAPAVAGFGLIPFSCIPQVALPKAVVNAAFQAENPSAVVDKLPVISPAGFLPDVLGAQQCVSNALAEFRKDVSNVGAAKFQAAMQACMDKLTNECNQTICNCINAGASPFKSTVTLNTDVQFTTRPINVNVILRDASGTSISNNIPKSCNIDILGHVTFGSITPFTYDGYTSFNAQITSNDTGQGELTIEFNGKILSQVVNSGTVSAAIEELATPYQFIESVVVPPVRRDATDVAGIDTNTE